MNDALLLPTVHTSSDVRRLWAVHTSIFAAGIAVHGCVVGVLNVDNFQWVAGPGKQGVGDDGDEGMELGGGGGVHLCPGEVKLLPVQDGVHCTVVCSLASAELRACGGNVEGLSRRRTLTLTWSIAQPLSRCRWPGGCWVPRTRL